MVTRKENNFTKIPQWYEFYIILRIDKLMNSMQKFCQRGVIRMVISGDFAFTRTQKFPVELWRGRYRTNFTGNTNHNNFFRDLCRHSIKTFFNFLSMSILFSFNAQIIYIIILCKFFFLFIGRKPTMWPVNNCLQIMVCSCVMSSNFVWLQIIFCSVEMKPRFSPSCDRSCMKYGRSLCCPKIFIENQLGDRMIKQLLNLVIAKCHYLSVPRRSACHWQITTFCSTLSNNC